MADIKKKIDKDRAAAVILHLTRAAEHRAGQHNQKSHGYRFGSAPKLSKARDLKAAGLWQDYKQRAKAKKGGGKVQGAAGEKPPARPKEIADLIKKTANAEGIDAGELDALSLAMDKAIDDLQFGDAYKGPRAVSVSAQILASGGIDSYIDQTPPGRMRDLLIETRANVSKQKATADPVQWRPVMSKEEAIRFTADSKYKAEVFHVTKAGNIDQIRRDGFNLDRVALGRVWGDGVYVGTDGQTKRFYEVAENIYREKGVKTATARMMVNIRNPAIIDASSPKGNRISTLDRYDEYKPIFNQYKERARAVNQEIENNNPAVLWRKNNPPGRYGFGAPLPENIQRQSIDYTKRNADRIIPDLDSYAMTNALKDMGYDSVMVNIGDYFNPSVGGNQIVVFDPRNVVIVED